jgi:hypothetical protein
VEGLPPRGRPRPGRNGRAARRRDDRAGLEQAAGVLAVWQPQRELRGERDEAAMIGWPFLAADAILTIAGLSARCRSTSTPGPPGPSGTTRSRAPVSHPWCWREPWPWLVWDWDRHNNHQNLAQETREPGCGRALCIAPVRKLVRGPGSPVRPLVTAARNDSRTETAGGRFPRQK